VEEGHVGLLYSCLSPFSEVLSDGAEFAYQFAGGWRSWMAETTNGRRDGVTPDFDPDGVLGLLRSMGGVVKRFYQFQYSTPLCTAYSAFPQ